MDRVVIVGGGIAGLATALDLRDRARDAGRAVDVVVLEASDRVGGNIRTRRENGFTIETGPNGFLDNAPATLDLVRRIALDDRLQRADESASKRFIYRAGRLVEAPTGPLSFLRSPLLSLRGRLRVFAEPFARARPPGVDESVYDFAARRIGPEAAGVLVDAMVSGVFAGDVRRLSLASSFPKMADMEARHGGLVKAMIARMKERKAAKREAEERRARGEDVAELTRPGGPAGPGGTLTSFREGLDTLVLTLARVLGDRVRTDARVTSLARNGAGRPWTVRLEGGGSLDADAVVLAIPSPRAAPLLQELDAELAGEVAGIETAGLAVVALGFDRGRGPELDGFGFLVPRGEGPRVLGCLWDSSIFPGRAEDGRVLLRAMIGGAHDPAAVHEDQDALVARVREDLRETMGLEARPDLVRVYRWPLGIGQYHVGHGQRLGRIARRLDALPGLWLAGSSYHGVSMNACIEKAEEHADQIVAYLAG